MSNKIEYYAVHKENALGYIFFDDYNKKRFGVLRASVIRGSTINELSDPIYIYNDKVIRRATIQDFDSYGCVVPPDFQGLNKPDWLFIGVYPNAYVYCDTRKEERGDYKEICFIYFRPLEFKVMVKDQKPYQEVIDLARWSYENIKANIDKPIEVSATGQTVQPYLKSPD